MKKGFTLIELLSIIVILAIIALIAIPQITNIVENAKKEAGARSVEGHVESINTELAKKMLLNSDLSDGEYSLNSLDVKTKGNTTCTSYTIKSNTVVSASNCEANGYTYSYNMENGAYILAGSKGSNAVIYAKNNGRLHVTGSKLMNSKNQEFRLIGASNAVAPQSKNAVIKPVNKMYTEKSLGTLKSWGANGFRIFCGREFWDSTLADYNDRMVDLKDTVNTLIKLDMYVILNWNPGGEANGSPQTEAAQKFFSDITSYYKNDYHILYEIWNEPNANNSWEQISEYANQVIPVIRTNAPDSIVLVGTSNYDSRIDQVIGHELSFKNVMYSHHTYATNVSSTATLDKALAAGLPIFETECSSVDSGTPKGNYINPAHANYFFTYLKKHNINFMYFCWEGGVWAYNILDSNANTWDESLPDSKLRESGLFLKKVLKNNFETGSHLLIVNSSEEGKYFRTPEWKDKIVSVKFKNKLNVPSNIAISWDMSALQDKSIIAYLTPSSETGMYDLTFAANGYINLPANSSNFFRGLTNVKSYDFTNLKTELVTNMSFMFTQNSSLETLDVSSFDTSKLVYMNSFASSCKNLKSINFNGWAPKLITIYGAFWNDEKINNLDLSNFDVSRVSNFSNIFYRNLSLSNLDISKWQPKKVDVINYMFYETRNLTSADLSGFKTFSDTYEHNKVFDYTNSNISIKTGNETFKTDMKALYPNLNIQ